MAGRKLLMKSKKPLQEIDAEYKKMMGGSCKEGLQQKVKVEIAEPVSQARR